MIRVFRVWENCHARRRLEFVPGDRPAFETKKKKKKKKEGEFFLESQSKLDRWVELNAFNFYMSQSLPSSELP